MGHVSVHFLADELPSTELNPVGRCGKGTNTFYFLEIISQFKSLIFLFHRFLQLSISYGIVKISVWTSAMGVDGTCLRLIR